MAADTPEHPPVTPPPPRVDKVPDTGPDAGPDAGPNADPDEACEKGADAGPDTGPNAGPDPGPDTGLAAGSAPKALEPVPAKPRSHGRLSISASFQPRALDGPPTLRGAWEARVITLFPDAFPGTLGLSLTGKALDMGLWRLVPIDLRTFGEGRHRNVDDSPAGGGAGMVLRADVVGRALETAAEGLPGDRARWPVVYLSPRGRPFTQAMARGWAAGQGLTLLCGRFEGVDQRALDHHGVEEVSLGDFVLTGGEIAAQAVIDATVRLIPGVLGNHASTEEESFSDGLLEHPQFTRPTLWQGRDIPPVLLSGNHADIAKWRRERAESLTRERRPDLWEKRPRDGG